MTLREFKDDVTSWGELIYLCNEESCSVCDNVTDTDGFNEYLNDSLYDWARENTWDELYSILDDYNRISGYEWYEWDDDYGEYRPLDDYSDFDRYKEEVEEWMVDNDRFDPEDGDEEEEDEETSGNSACCQNMEAEIDPEDEEITPDEDVSLSELVESSIGCVTSISEEALREARELDRAFIEFFGGDYCK